MKRLALLLILAVALLVAPSGAFAKDKHKKHKHYKEHSRYYNDRCDDRGSYYRRSYYDDRCNDRSYYRPSYSYYRPTYYAPAPVYYAPSRSYYRGYDNCRPVRRSSGVRLVVGF